MALNPQEQRERDEERDLSIEEDLRTGRLAPISCVKHRHQGWTFDWCPECEADVEPFSGFHLPRWERTFEWRPKFGEDVEPL